MVFLRIIKFCKDIKCLFTPCTICIRNNFLLLFDLVLSNLIEPLPIAVQLVLLIWIDLYHTSCNYTSNNLSHILDWALEEKLLNNLRVSKLRQYPFRTFLISVDIGFQYIDESRHFSSIFWTNKNDQKVWAYKSEDILLIYLFLLYQLRPMVLSTKDLTEISSSSIFIIIVVVIFPTIIIIIILNLCS